MSFGGDDLFNVFESSNQTNGFQKRKAKEEQPVIIEEKKSKQEDDGK